jgi:hypothetical protein
MVSHTIIIIIVIIVIIIIFIEIYIYIYIIDGFMPGEQYPSTYNRLVKKAVEKGIIKPTGCPERLINF